jgi:hypothetical protein
MAAKRSHFGSPKAGGPVLAIQCTAGVAGASGKRLKHMAEVPVMSGYRLSGTYILAYGFWLLARYVGLARRRPLVPLAAYSFKGERNVNAVIL